LIAAILDHILTDQKSLLLNENVCKKFSSKKIAFYIVYEPDTQTQIFREHIRQVFSKNNFEFHVVQNIESQVSTESTNTIFRKNRGFDLGAYRDVLRVISDTQSEVLFLNDSIYWDVIQLDRLLSHLDNMNDGAYFLTDSHQPFHHFQSYFMFLKGKTAILQAKNWLGTIRNWHRKTAAIEFGELRNAKYFKDSAHILFPYSELIKSAELHYQKPDLSVFTKERLKFCLRNVRDGIPLNPTHHFYFELLQLGFPGIKRDLVKLNPSGIPDLEISSSIFKKNIPQDIVLSNGIKLKQKSKMLYYVRHTLRL
jgi:hypothetical protein